MSTPDESTPLFVQVDAELVKALGQAVAMVTTRLSDMSGEDVWKLTFESWYWLVDENREDPERFKNLLNALMTQLAYLAAHACEQWNAHQPGEPARWLQNLAAQAAAHYSDRR